MTNHINPASIATGLAPTFMGKVMSLFALSILISAGGVFVGMEYLMSYLSQNPYLMFGLFIVELGLIFTSSIWSRTQGLNYLLFIAFTFISGLTVAPLIGIVASSPEGVAILAKALLVTGCTFTAMALVGWTTRVNLTSLGGFLMIALIGMIIIGIIGFFIPWGNTGEIVYSALGILLFSGFTAYQFQMLKHYPEDRYIEAAIALYLDIFNLFISVLRLLSALSNRD